MSLSSLRAFGDFSRDGKVTSSVIEILRCAQNDRRGLPSLFARLLVTFRRETKSYPAEHVL